ncbi:hypothetical protein [Jatrophihabitans fulvus]
MAIAFPEPVEPAEFAAEFRRAAVTEERVASALGSVASRSVRIGPYAAGPLARVSAAGVLGTPRVRRTDPSAPAFVVTVPATLELSVRVGVESRVRADVEIDLTLTPRPAHPLVLVIDIAALQASDVRIRVRGRGLGAAVSGLIGVTPGAVTDEVRRQVACQVSNLLDGDALRRARTIDVAARIDGASRPTPGRRDAVRWQWIGDAEFGERFLARAVTRERVAHGFGTLAGRPLSIGPLKVGPGGMAEVRAEGAVGTPEVSDDPAGGYAVTLPLGLDIAVVLARENRYHADVRVALRAVARPAAGLTVVIDIPPVGPDDVAVTLTPADNLAGMLARAGKLEDQLVAQVVRTVNDQIGDAAGRVVDIGARVAG